MKKLIRVNSLHILSVVVLSLAVLSCDGGDGGGDGGGQPQGEQITINGRVADVVTALAPAEKKSFMLAYVKKLLTITETADAQSGVPDIEVIATNGEGEVLASDFTDASGNFSLVVIVPPDSPSPISITLNFITDEFSLFLELLLFPGSSVDLVITLHPGEDEVIVDDMILGHLVCEDGEEIFIDDVFHGFVIDGGGHECIRTEGSCFALLNLGDIVLTNCGDACIRTEGESEVIITSEADIICEANDVGIRSEGESGITLDALGEIFISGDVGIRAEGSSEVILGASICTIDAFDPIIVEGEAFVSTVDCLVEDFAILSAD